MCRQTTFILYYHCMAQTQSVSEKKLAGLAKRFREKAGKSRAEAARDMRVSQTSIFQAEEMPEQGLTKLRKRMIETYSPFKVVGPVFLLYLERKPKRQIVQAFQMMRVRDFRPVQDGEKIIGVGFDQLDVAQPGKCF